MEYNNQDEFYCNYCKQTKPIEERDTNFVGMDENGMPILLCKLCKEKQERPQRGLAASTTTANFM